MSERLSSVLVYLASASLLNLSSTQAQQAAQPDPQFHLYLLMGQSNMAGRGLVDEESKVAHPRVLMLDKKRTWIPATDPLHFDKPVAGVGPGLTFGKKMADTNPAIRIGLIPCAVGGTSITSWVPGQEDKSTRTHPYDDMLERAKAAMQTGTLKGVIWHQGESDVRNPSYGKLLTELIERLRKDLSAPYLVFVASELTPLRPENAEAVAAFNAAVRDLRVANYGWISAAGLDHKGDKVHYNTASARQLGQRFAEKMLAQPPDRRAGADDAKAIADAIHHPVEKDPRVQSDGKPWGINKATVSDPARPRVLLIGDSILNGYANTVIKRLSGTAYVDYWVTPACQSERFNQMLTMALTNGPYDVIHINLGLHGFQRDCVVKGVAEKQPRIPDGQFEPLTKSFVEVMRKENPRGKIIWASTTPISLRDKPAELDPVSNPIIIEHNRMAAKVMAEMGVPVNDLYTLSVNRLDLKENDFHWKDGAKKLQGEAVADCVLKLLTAKP